MLFAGSNELGMIKIKEPLEDDWSNYIKSRCDVYIKRVEDILASKICNFYKVPICGDILSYIPFNCLHFCHSGCLIHCKKYGLSKGNS